MRKHTLKCRGPNSDPLKTAIIACVPLFALWYNDLIYLSSQFNSPSPFVFQEPVCQEGEGQSARGSEGSRVEAVWESPTTGRTHQGP